MTDMGGALQKSYKLQRHPLSVREDEYTDWVKNELSRRLKVGNARQRAQAKELISRFYWDDEKQ
jgi:hypothetical protein